MLQNYIVTIAGKVKAVEKKSFEDKTQKGKMIEWTEIYLTSPKCSVDARVNVSKNYKLPKVGDDAQMLVFTRMSKNPITGLFEVTYKAVEE